MLLQSCCNPWLPLSLFCDTIFTPLSCVLLVTKFTSLAVSEVWLTDCMTSWLFVFAFLLGVRTLPASSDMVCLEKYITKGKNRVIKCHMGPYRPTNVKTWKKLLLQCYKVLFWVQYFIAIDKMPNLLIRFYGTMNRNVKFLPDSLLSTLPFFEVG